MSVLDQSNWANNQQEAFNEEYVDKGMGFNINNGSFQDPGMNQDELIQAPEASIGEAEEVQQTEENVLK